MVGGPRWTKMDLFRPKRIKMWSIQWTIFGLVNAGERAWATAIRGFQASQNSEPNFPSCLGKDGLSSEERGIYPHPS